ncbi:MAG: DMT family transporter [Eubacteriales bacterium]
MDKIRGIAYIIFAAIIFGFTPFFAKLSFANGFNEMTYILARCVLATLFLYFYIKKKGIDIKLNKRENWDMIKVSFLGYGLMYYTLLMAFHYMPTGIASSLHFVYPLVVMVGGVIFYNNKVHLSKVIVLIIAFTGIYFIVGYGSSGNITLIGLVLAIGSGVLYAYYILVVGTGSLKNISSYALVFYVSFYNIFYFIAFSLITNNMTFEITTKGYFFIIILSILSLLGTVTFKKGLELINTVTAAILSTFEPLTSLIVGVVILNEVLFPQHIVGSILIICAVIFAALIEKKENDSIKSKVEGKVK